MSSYNTVDDIEDYILKLLSDAKKNGLKELVLRAGQIHADLNLKQRITLVCSAMKKVFKQGDKILALPRKKLQKGYRERKPNSGSSFESQCEGDGMFNGFNLEIKYSTGNK
jgi:hypothetical protein